MLQRWTVSELEGSNSELKSSNEELRSVNEQLQSANKKLATSRENIQAGMVALSRARSDLQDLLDGTQIATIFLDQQGLVKSYTPSVQDIYNIKEGDTGRPLSDITHHVRQMPAVPNAEELAESSEPIVDEILTRDGRWFLRRSLPSIRDGRPAGSVLTFVDISERKRSELRIAAVKSVTHTLANAESFDDVASEILHQLRSHFNAQVCILWLPDKSNRELHCAECSVAEGTVPTVAFVQQSREMRFARDEGFPGYVWLHKKVAWISDMESNPNFLRRDAASRSGLVSGVAAPILTGDRIIGVVELFTNHTLVREPSLPNMLRDVGHEIGQSIRRMQLNNQFRDESARKTAILVAALDCIVTMDLKGNIVDFNHAAESTFGYRKTDVIGKPLAELLIPDDDRDAHISGLSRFLQTGESNVFGKRIELIAQRADGGRFPVELAINVSRHRDGTPFFTGFLRDITERKSIEQRLIDSEAKSRRLAEVVEHSNDFIGIAMPDGKWLYVNEAGRNMVGLESFEDVSSIRILDLIADVDREVMEQEAYPAMQDPGHWRGSVHFQHLTTGESIPTWWNAFVIKDPDGPIPEAWVTISPDLREINRLQRAVEENEQRLSMALQAGGMAAWEWTPLRSVWTNEVFDLLGIPVQSNPSTELFFQYVHPDELASLQRAWQRAIDGDSSYDHEFRIIRPDKSIRWLKGVGEHERDRHGNIVRVYGLNWDITAQKKAERRRERAAEIEHFLLQASTVLASSLDYETTLAAVTKLCVPVLADWAFVDLLDDNGNTKRVSVAHADPSQEDLAKKVAQFPAQREHMQHPPARALFTGEAFVIPEVTEDMIARAAQNAEHERVMREVTPKSFVAVPLMAREEFIGAVTLVAAQERTSKRSRTSKAKKSSPKSPPRPPTSDGFPIVGIGASAGGLKALQTILEAMPDEPGVAVVIVQHLDPTKKSLAPELLARCTNMQVAQISDDPHVKPNRVYVIPPDKYLSIAGSELHLSEPERPRGSRMAIDYFLRSLAADQYQCAVGVILSGTGTDGTLGVKAIKAAGGLVIAQEPQTAEHDGMPRSAIDAGVVDHILPLGMIPDVLIR